MISIITAVKNNKKDIENCIQSVAEQSYQSIEHIIIDGKSDDGTLDIIKKCKKKYTHISWISEEDKGVYDAYNKGIKMAKGDWIFFLGSDDKLISNTIIEELKIDTEFFGYNFIYGKILLKETGEVLGNKTDINGLKKTPTNHQATFIKKNLFEIIGEYNIKYKICADWAFAIKTFQNKDARVLYVDKLISEYSLYGKSNTYTGRNPRLLDKNFNKDFFHLFENYTFKEKIYLKVSDYTPKYLRPKIYINFYYFVSRKILTFSSFSDQIIHLL